MPAVTEENVRTSNSRHYLAWDGKLWISFVSFWWQNLTWC